MKAVAYIGSPRGEESNTYKLTEQFLNRLQKELELKYKIFSTSNCKIENCKGCLGCFDRWCKCKAIHDDLEIIIEEMLNADIIILASPVYMHNVSGNMKNFIDRLSIWCHFMKLAGKIGVTISYSRSNGNIFVSDYLTKVMTYWGVAVISNIDYLNINLDTNESEAIKKIIDVINKKKKMDVTAQNTIFNVYKSAFQNLGKKNPDDVEYNYWENSGMLEKNSFEELLGDKNIYLVDKQ